MAKFPANENILVLKSCKEHDLMITEDRMGLYILYRKDHLGMHWLFSYKYKDDALNHLAREFRKCSGTDLITVGEVS